MQKYLFYLSLAIRHSILHFVTMTDEDKETGTNSLITVRS